MVDCKATRGLYVLKMKQHLDDYIYLEDKGMEEKWRTTRREDLAVWPAALQGGVTTFATTRPLPGCVPREEVLDATSFIRGCVRANRVISTRQEILTTACW